MQAVLASLFEKELDETINVIDYLDDGWAIPFFDWVESFGFDYVGVMAPAETVEQSKKDLSSLYAVGGFFYASVPSKNYKGISHAVIIDRNGLVVHDPHPQKAWEGINVVESGDIDYWYLFEPMVTK